MRYAVIGDVHGHLDPLCTELVRLGADPVAATLPDDLTIVQVGDLVHRGPCSEQVVELVDRFLVNGAGRWIQLVGNHEAQYLRHPAFRWSEWISSQAQEMVRGWWARHEMVAAAVLPGPDGDVLVTHAGLTEEFWRRDLGSAQTATAAAALLNEMAAHGDNTLFRPGSMLTGGRPNHRAGPLWAQAGQEVVGSWQGRKVPFSQVHGHSSSFDWQRGVWREDANAQTETLSTAGHEITQLDGGWIVGVDPDHGIEPRLGWHAWELPTARDASPNAA